MRTIGTLLVSWVVFWAIAPCLASGWNDYELDIGDGYQIVRCNSLEIGLAKKGKNVLIMPGPTDAVGPIVGYSVTDKFILTKNHGKKPRNLFAGDTFQDIDSSRVFYFVLAKVDDGVVGPLSESEFKSHPAVSGIGQVAWKTPRNPNILLPLAGSLLFLLIAIPILAIKYYWVTVPLLLAFLYWVVGVQDRRKPA